MSVGDLQKMVMLAVARLGGGAFSKAIREEVSAVGGRDVSVSTVYVTLVRLEDQGLLESVAEPPDPVRGGKGKRLFRVTPAGWSELREARAAMARMWDGVEPA